jgi:hypothetical protein
MLFLTHICQASTSVENFKRERSIVRVKPSVLIFVVIALVLSSSDDASAQTFTTERITDHVFMLQNQAGGENQLVITSEKGLVVFGSFWSSITAQTYKDAISKAFDREDFYLTVNMVDRLDMFGGNAAYGETTIIGHKNLFDKYRGKEKEVDAEIKRLIDMWRWKEEVSRERLKTHEVGSKEEIDERRWMNTCKQRADDLEQGFSLVLPTTVYEDRKRLDLGDITLELIWFGRTGYDGMTVAVVPDEKIAIIPGFIMHSQHLAPHPHARYVKLDVPRWIDVFEEILEGDEAVDRVVCDINQVWSRERARTHLVYIRRLWDATKKAAAAGKSLAETQEQLSLDTEFAFVKEMQPYIDGGDDWVRPQHQSHVRVFYLQHKKMASDVLKEKLENSPRTAIASVRKLRDSGSDLYFDEPSLNEIGYDLLAASRYAEAIEVFELNVELFPGSANAHDSLAEAYMKSGDSEKAIIHYQKSLELDPGNENAKEKLKELEKE